MNVTIAKLLSLVAIALVSLGFGLLPYYVVRWFHSHGVLRTPRVRLFISAVICFSGGTLLGVAFLHLMPDMREKLDRLGLEGYWGSLPMSDIITCGGFFFVYIVDELMHMFIEWYSSRIVTIRHDIVGQTATATSSQQINTMFLENEIGIERMESNRGRTQDQTYMGSKNEPNVSTAPLHHEVHLHSDAHLHIPSIQIQENLSIRHLAVSGFHGHDPNPIGHPLDSGPIVPPLTGLITIVALSFHDIFEGLAIGIECDVKDVLFLYLSIAAHKYAIAFCIGMDLVLSGTKGPFIVMYMLTFSLVSPLGILVGMSIVRDQDHTVHIDTPVTVVLQGLAGGTLIYVVCFEVLQREGSATHAKGVCNVLFVLIGFLLTLVFKVVLGHSHSKNESRHH